MFLTIFGLRRSIVLTFSIAAYPVWFGCTHTIEPNYLELIVLLRKIYNILFRILTVVKHPCVLNINEAKTSSKLPLLPYPGMSLQYFHDCNVACIYT